MRYGDAMGDTLTVIKWGAFSRICIVLLQVISHNLIPDHKGSLEDVFMRHHRHPPHDLITETLFGGFDNWDSEYFIFIAQHGYSRYEQTMAFFPLYPFLMGLFAKTALFPLSLWMFPRSILLVSGVLLNLIIFPLAAAVLYLLTMEISKNKKLSLLTAALFCMNPASVFMSAVYTGCLFAALTFSGMLALEKRQPWASTFLFALAGATRSNGMVLCGFIAYYHLITILHNIKQTSSFVKSMVNILKILITAAAQCCIVMLPFVLFQSYGYMLYCTSGYTPPPWCTQRIPISYSYIQEKYWNVGFLSYYEMKQLPNFLLAAPMILLSIYCVWSYLRGWETTTGTEQMKDIVHLRPYILHLVFLLVFGVLNINVQVITRFICSSSPVIYWFPAEAMLQTLELLKKAFLLDPNLHSLSEMIKGVQKALFSPQQVPTGHHSGIVTKLTILYFLAYVILGCILHCNFFPWT